MKKQLVIIGIIVALLVCVGLSGCFDFLTTSSDVKGIWHEGDYTTWNFQDNDILTKSYSSGSSDQYTWDMDAHYVYVIDNGFTTKYRYTSLNDKKTLLLESIGESITLTR